MFVFKRLEKKGLDAARITLCPFICWPSAQTRVTSAKSLFSLKSLKIDWMLSWKLFHFKLKTSFSIFVSMLCRAFWWQTSFCKCAWVFLMLLKYSVRLIFEFEDRDQFWAFLGTSNDNHNQLNSQELKIIMWEQFNTLCCVLDYFGSIWIKAFVPERLLLFSRLKWILNFVGNDISPILFLSHLWLNSLHLEINFHSWLKIWGWIWNMEDFPRSVCWVQYSYLLHKLWWILLMHQ